GDRLREGRKVLAIDVVSPCEIRGTESGTETVGELSEIVVGDVDIAQRLLLLFRERKQGRLADVAGLNSAGYGEVRAESRLSRIVVRFREGCYWSEAFQHGHVRG